MKYLPHVDGLRAIAVLAVVIFHLGFGWAPGGFVGVDVFFVISGFLISSIILQEMDERKFTLRNFYMRRIRRILPALFVTIIATLIAGALLQSPDRFEALGASAAAATLSVSNIYFWLTAGYFDTEALAKPLLHTWSLSVEEQFYLVWPALLLLVRRPRWLLASVVALMFVGSLAASYLMTPAYAEATFYLAPFRLFEFALGMACIFARASAWQPGKILATLLTLIGFALIAYSIALFTGATPFPGAAAFIPCGGSALLIAYADKSYLNFSLANPVSVYLGKVSYSLYLVHWPILVFLTYLRFDELTNTDKAIAAGLMAVATLALHYLVERPFRFHALRKRPAVLVSVIGTVALALVVASCAAWKTEGMPTRFSPETQALLAYRVPDETWRPYPQCYIGRRRFREFDPAFCLARDPDKINVLLLGDSISARMRAGLTASFPDINLMQAGAASCSAIRGYQTARSPGCEDLNRFVFDEFIPGGGIDYVILSSNWTRDREDQIALTLEYLARFDVQVILVGPGPIYTQPLPEIAFRGRNTGDLAGYAESFLEPRQRDTDARLRHLAGSQHVQYIDLFELLCDSDRCDPLTESGRPILADKHHLTPEASIEVFDRLKREGLLPFDRRPPALVDP